MASIVWYPSNKELGKTLIALVSNTLPIGIIKPLTIKINNIIISVGVKYLPIVSIIDVFPKTKNKLIMKYMTIAIKGDIPLKNGLIDNSNVVAAVLGIASIGPIAINSIAVKITANFGLTLFAMDLKLPSPLEQDIIAKSGNPTPVNIKPIIPKRYWSPIVFPKNAGNIKLPAPKNIENRANPTTIESFVLFFILFPP